MQVSKILCDRCNKEINGNPSKVVLMQSERTMGYMMSDVPGIDTKQASKDYCEECVNKIIKFLKGEEFSSMR